MNHIYRVIFNHTTNTFQAVAEIAKGHSKSHTQKQSVAKSITQSSLIPVVKPLSLLISLLLTSTFTSVAMASPTGGQVSAGQANISQNGLTTNINQSSQNAAINWQDFSIKANETINFNQPNTTSVTLNRVLGNEKSVIDGAMNANGNVFIQNPNGTLIGNGAQINVGGLVATTANISDDDLMNGNYQFNGSADGSIENYGSITVPEGGVVALIAPIVKNQGTITAPKANVLLASAERFSITLPDVAGGTNFSYTLDRGTLEGLVDNGGAILADGGRVVLTTLGVDTVKKSVLKHTGVIEANTVQNNNGVIELLGDLDNSELQLSGTLKAEATGDDNGGFIETSASKLNIADEAVVSTKAENGKTGTWLIDPKDFTVASSGGDITGQQVSTALDSNNVTLKSTDGQAEGKGDVIVDDTINWNKNTLTLNAQNDIYINKTMNGSGTAKLALEYGQGTADGGETDFYLRNGGVVYIPKGQNFEVKKGLSGVKHNFMVITELGTESSNGDGSLQDIRNNPSANYALGNNIDLTSVKSWNSNQGWEPIDDFSGKLYGLGHTLTNLTIKKNATNLGMFSHLQGEISDLKLINANVALLDSNNSGYRRTSTLAGHSSGIIKRAYVSGQVFGDWAAGGLVAGNSGKIIESGANVDVLAWRDSGGLVGVNRGLILNSYATGDVSGTTDRMTAFGALLGVQNGSSRIKNSYATGKVAYPGGSLVGYSCSGWDCKAWTGANENSFWNSDTASSNYYQQPWGATPKSTNKLKQKTTFQGWDFDNVWRIDEGNDYPCLRALTEAVIVVDPSSLDVKANDLTKTYDGKAVNTQADLEKLDGWNGTGVTATGLLDGDKLGDTDVFTGTLAFDGEGSNWQGAKNAGNYTIVPTGLGSQKYEIKWGDGTLAITPAVLVLKGQRTYDGTKQVDALDRNKVKITGIVGDDATELDVLGTATLVSKDVGIHRLASDDFKVSENYANNYIIDTDASRWQIDKAELSAEGVKTYDTTVNVTANDIINESLNIYGNDDVTIKGDGKLLNRHAGESTLVNHTFELVGKDSSNYKLNPRVNWIVKQKNLTIQAQPDEKFYDGTTASSETPAVYGIYRDFDTAKATQEFDSADVKGKDKSTLRATVKSIEDGNGGDNYYVEYYSAKGTILPNSQWKIEAEKRATLDEKTQEMPDGQVVKITDEELLNGNCNLPNSIACPYEGKTLPDVVIDKAMEEAFEQAAELFTYTVNVLPQGFQFSIYDTKWINETLEKSRNSIYANAANKFKGAVSPEVLKGFIIAQAFDVIKDFIQKDMETRFFSGNIDYFNAYEKFGLDFNESGKFVLDVFLNTFTDMGVLATVSPQTYASPAGFVAAFKISLTLNLSTATYKGVNEFLQQYGNLIDEERNLASNILGTYSYAKDRVDIYQNVLDEIAQNKNNLPQEVFNELKQKNEKSKSNYQELQLKVADVYIKHYEDKGNEIFFSQRYPDCDVNDVIQMMDTALSITNYDRDDVLYLKGLRIFDYVTDDNGNTEMLLTPAGLSVYNMLENLPNGGGTNNKKIEQSYDMLLDFLSGHYGINIHTAGLMGSPLGGDLRKILDNAYKNSQKMGVSYPNTKINQQIR